MPSIEWNRRIWDDTYDWEGDGNEWSGWWDTSQAMWRWAIFPRIADFVPAPTILEIAPGFGRWSQFLHRQCSRLILVDLAEKCIDACRQRFEGMDHIEYHVNDGISLDMVPDHSVDFAMSIDSLVHVERDVVAGYIEQLSRKLSPDGVAFIHHSNGAHYRRYFSLADALDPGGAWSISAGTAYPPERPGAAKLVKALTAAHVLDPEQGRGRSVSAELVVEWARDAGLITIGQEITNWDSHRVIDCFSILTAPGSRFARPNIVVTNRTFMREATDIKLKSRLYDFDTKDHAGQPEAQIRRREAQSPRGANTMFRRGP